MTAPLQEKRFELFVRRAVDPHAGVPLRRTAAFRRQAAAAVADRVTLEPDRDSAAVADLLALVLLKGMMPLGGQQQEPVPVADVLHVHVQPDSELMAVTIHWAGGYESQHEIDRPVRRYEHLRDLEPLLNRVRELRQTGRTVGQIAEQLNAEGFHSPTRRGRIKGGMVTQLLKRQGLIPDERSRDDLLGPHEWWLSDLAETLNTSRSKLQEWASRGWVLGRKTLVQGCWILWADGDEMQRLHQLLARSQPGKNRHASDLKTPKRQPGQE